MSLFWLDTETFSELELKNVGAYNYAQHPSTEVMILSCALDNGPVQVHDLTLPGHTELAVKSLKAALADPHVTFIAQNSAFDRLQLKYVLGVDIPTHRWRDSMIKALLHGFPGALDAWGKALGQDEDVSKLADGKRLINRFCKPSPKNMKIRRCTRETHPEEWARFMEYAGQDIVAMREQWYATPGWNYQPIEHKLWMLDQKINDRGFYADRELAVAGAHSADAEQALLLEQCVQLTGGVVEGPTKVKQLKEYLQQVYGMTLDSLNKTVVAAAIENPLTPAGAKELLRLRQMAGKTSTSKYSAILGIIGPDGRVRGTIQFSGAARTRRAAGRKFQPQNLPSRGIPKHTEIEAYIGALKRGHHDLLFDNLLLFGSAAIRGLVIAPPGKKLVVSDLSNIEGRMVAYLAGEEWKLVAFREYDAGTGPDLYNVTAASIIGGDPWKVAKSDRNAYGKVSELACFGPDTLVLTRRGLVPIVGVLSTDELWDGIEWVKHNGVVERGVRTVVLVDGTTVTPDHLIRTGTTWTPAGRLATSDGTLSRALATGSENLPSPGSFMGLRGESGPSKSAAPVERQSTQRTHRTYDSGAAHAAGSAHVWKRTGGSNGTTATPMPCRMKDTGVGCSTGSTRPSTAAGTPTTEHGLTTAGAVSRFIRTGCRIGDRFFGTLLRYLAGTTRLWNWTGRMSTGTTSRGISDLSPDQRTGTTSAQSQNCSSVSPSLSPVFDVMNAGPRNRFTIRTSSGFLLVHNCGYGGGVNAFQTFAQAYQVSMAPNWPRLQETLSEYARQATESWDRYGNESDIPPEEWLASETVKLAWRARHPATVALWAALEDAAYKAMENPGMVFQAGPRLFIKVDEYAGRRWLRTKLPSGRYVTYFMPRREKRGWSYMGVDTKQGSPTNGQWIRLFNYGGRMLEQATQATSRDVLFDSMPAIEDDGFEIVLHVHDEIVAEAPDTDEYNADRLSAHMARGHSWTEGLPLSAAGFESYRYRKD